MLHAIMSLVSRWQQQVLEHVAELVILGVALAALYLVRDLGSRVARLELELRALRDAHQDRAAAGAVPSTGASADAAARSGAAAGTPAAGAASGAASSGQAPAPSGDPEGATHARTALGDDDGFAAVAADSGRQPAAAAYAPRAAAPAPVHRPGNVPDADSTRASDAAPRRAAASRRTRAPFAEAGGDSLPGALGRFFAGGNWLVSGGIVLLFLGVGFLLKFAVDNLHFPPAWRLAAAGLGGVALVVLGLRLVARRRAYALALQGGGVGLLYLSLYAAFRLYGLLPAGAAFMLMGMVVVAAGWLAVRQDALALAVLGAVGGFAAPLLASTGAGSHVLLFSYYALLNAGVLGIAYFRAWRVLNLVGFAATFVAGGLWGHRYYEPAYLASVEPFLVLFFAMYLGVAMLFALRRSLHLRDPMDGTLVFATPLVFFGLQSRLLADTTHGLALSALLLAAIYTLCAVLLWRRVGARVGVLVEAFAALAVGFATVALALAFDARWTSASWALEGAALVWVGWRQRRVLARLAGAALQVGAGAVWAWQVLAPGPFATGDWLGTVMIATAGLLSGAVLARGEDGGDERVLSVSLGLWGLLWWCGGGVLQLHAQLAPAALSGGLLLFFAASALALEVAGARLRWAIPRGAALLLPWVLCAIALAQVFDDAHPLVSLAAPAWPLALAAAALVLRRHDAAPTVAVCAGHALGLWLLAALAAWELAWWFREWLPPVSSWLRLAWLLAPAALVAIVSWRARRAWPWPLDVHARLYLTIGCGPLLGALAGGVFALGVGDPDGPWPVPYLPLLNPLDVGLAACFAAGVLWYRSTAALLGPGARNLCVLAGVMLAFVCVNGVLLRTLHLWADVPYRFSAMFHSTLVQASLSLLWVLTGLVTMVGASRAASRAAWAAGAALMGCVVVKLMLVDLANSATVARIVSFISVGLIMMLVGYLAPVPPRRAAAPSAAGAVRGATSPSST